MRPALLASVAAALLAHAAVAWMCLQPNPRAATHRDRVVALTLWRVPDTPPPMAPPAPRRAATTRPAKSPLERAEASPSPVRRGRPPVAQEDTKAVVLGGQTYLGSAALDQVALPRSAPDTSMIEGLPWSGVPLRLRLFVDAQGTVVDVRVLQTADLDDVVDHVRHMFLATGFIPARAHGVDVASYKDVELDVGGPA